MTQDLAKASRDRENIRSELFQALEAVKRQNSEPEIGRGVGEEWTQLRVFSASLSTRHSLVSLEPHTIRQIPMVPSYNGLSLWPSPPNRLLWAVPTIMATLPRFLLLFLWDTGHMGYSTKLLWRPGCPSGDCQRPERAGAQLGLGRGEAGFAWTGVAQNIWQTWPADVSTHSFQGFLSQHTRGRGYWLGLRAVRHLNKIQGYRWVDGASLNFR